MLYYNITEVNEELIKCQEGKFWGKFTVIFENGKIHMLNIAETKKKIEVKVKKCK
jgi:hypothetical protein